jgi:hypothetical protein
LLLIYWFYIHSKLGLILQPQPPPPQPAEMFVPSSGITYYSPQNQVPRHTPLKRPKAAIPILPPPPKDKDRGLAARQESPSSSQSASTSTQEEGTPISNSNESSPPKEDTQQKEVSIQPEQVIATEKVDVMPVDKVTESVPPEVVKENEKISEIIIEETPEEKNVSLEVSSVNSEPEMLPKEIPVIGETSTESAPSDALENLTSGESNDPLPTEVSA